MKNRIIILFVLGFILSSHILNAQIPDFELQNTDNEYLSYSELQGDKITIIDFWATWCKPCVNSIPKLMEIYEDYQSQGVNLIGISIDSPRNVSKVKPFTHSLGIEYPILLDMNNEVSVDLNVTAIPTLLMVDSEDNITYIHEGFKPGDEKIIRNEIEKLLAEQ